MFLETPNADTVSSMERLDAVGDPALRSTLLFVRGLGRPATTDEAAAALSVPRTVARSRLERLAKAGLLSVTFERRTGRVGPGAGRPTKTYTAAPETSTIEFPRHHYETLVRLLAGALPSRAHAGKLRDIGGPFADELARAAHLRTASSLPRAVDGVCRALGRLGFQAHVESAGDDEAVIVSSTCPLRPVIVGDPSVRPLDEGMWAGLIEAATRQGTAARVRCSTHDCLDASAPCRIVVSLTA
jgi:predicted ArsR family transcriptional regulator